MAMPELPQELRDAGGEYLARIRALGLRPEGLFWVYDFTDSRFVLWLIWSGIDKFGPLSVSKLLFKAFNKGLLPRAVDPFVVEARSPKMQSAQFLMGTVADLAASANVAHQIAIRDDPDMPTEADIKYEVPRDGIYHIQMEPRSVHKVREDWRRFSRNVERAAA